MSNHDISQLRERFIALQQAPPDVDLVGSILSDIEETANPIVTEITNINEKLESAGLSKTMRRLYEGKIKSLEAELAPWKVLEEGIAIFVESFYTDATMTAKIAVASAQFSNRDKVEADRATLEDTITELVQRMNHGLSDGSAWQTRLKYAPIADDFNRLTGLIKTGDSESALTVAENILSTFDPVLLAKISSFDDIKAEMLNIFVNTAKGL